MMAQHFKIDILEVDKEYKAEVYCRYCTQNVFFPKKWWDSKVDALNDLLASYDTSSEERGMDLHLMMCKNYEKYMNNIMEKNNNK